MPRPLALPLLVLALLALLWPNPAAAQYAPQLSPPLACPSCECQRASDELRAVLTGIKQARRDLSTLGPTAMMAVGGAMAGSLFLVSAVRLNMTEEERGDDRFRGNEGRFWGAVGPLIVVNVGLVIGGALWRRSLLEGRRGEQRELARLYERRIEILRFSKQQCRGLR